MSRKSRLIRSLSPFEYSIDLEDAVRRNIAQSHGPEIVAEGFDIHLQQPALARTVALMRAPQALPPLIESCFTLMVDTLRTR